MRSRRLSVGAVAFVLGVATVGQAVLPATPAAAASACGQQDLVVTCVFHDQDAEGATNWTVPADIVPGSAVTITARGQAGEVGTSPYENGLVSTGGRGAQVKAGFVLAAGTNLSVLPPAAFDTLYTDGGRGIGSGVSRGTPPLLAYSSGRGGSLASVSVVGGDNLVVAGGGGGGGAGGALDPLGPIPTQLRGGYGGDAGLPGLDAGSGATGDAQLPLTGGAGGGGGAPTSVGGAAGGGAVGVAGNGGGFSFDCDNFTPGSNGGAGSRGLGGSAGDTGPYPVGYPPYGGGGGGGWGGGGAGGSGGYINCTYPHITAGGGGGGGSSYVNPTYVADSYSSSIVPGTADDGGSVTITYTITPPDVTAPVATIDPVTSPRLDAVDSLHFQYGEPVNATPDYTLTRDGVGIPDLPVTEGQFDFHGHFVGVTLDVSALTAAPGVYVFTVPAAGITDLAGNPVAADASITFTNTSVTGTFGVVDSPRASGVDSIPITFTTDVTGVDISDFRIFRDGNPTPLTGATLSGSGANYSIDGLGELTAPQLYPVDWELELRGPSETGIANAYGTGAPDTSVTFTVQAAAAPTATFEAVSSPRDAALDQEGVTFSEPVFAVDLTDFSLTRDGADVDLSGATLSGHGADYTVEGLSTLTAAADSPADYVLSLHDSGTNISNDEGVDLVSGTSVAFTVRARTPAVTSVAPAAGPSAGGRPVTITGSNFSGTPRVYFGGVLATDVTRVSDTQLIATTPEHDAGRSNVRVRTGTRSSTAVPADIYRFLDPPVVTYRSAAAGPTAGGNRVRIYGTRFGGASDVSFGAVPAAFSLVSPSKIIATVPAHVEGAVDITVTSTGGTSTPTPTSQYTYRAAPSVTDVSPASGPVGGGVPVTITGTGFTGASRIRFGLVATADFTVNSDSQITVTSPPHSVGRVNVYVRTPSGRSSGTTADRYRYAG